MPDPSEFDPGCELVAPGVERQRLLATMFAFLMGQGLHRIKARLHGCAAPPIITGTQSNHRADLECWQPAATRATGWRPICLDVVTLEEVDAYDWLHRYTLLHNACVPHGGSMCLAVPEGRAYRRLRSRLCTIDLNPARIWAL